MKIRNGFVSNSSSASFSIPSFLLTDEQKEMLLSLDDTPKDVKKFFKKEDNVLDYPQNEEYHNTLAQMEKDDLWWDSWSISESPEKECIWGSTMMNNGSLTILMIKIGIDLSITEFAEEYSIYMATHPEAMKYFADGINKEIVEFKKKTKEEQEEAKEFNFAPLLINPYEAKEKDFKDDQSWSITPYLEIDDRCFYKGRKI